MHLDSQHRGLQPDKRPVLRGLFRCVPLLFAVFTLGLVLTFASSPQISANANNGTSGTKQHLLQATHRKFKSVCGLPKPGYASCMADVTLNTSGQPLTSSSPQTVSGYGPAQFHTAYNLPCAPGGPIAAVCSTPSSFGPDTIAIVDAGNFETGVSGLETSLDDYSQNYGIPACDESNGCLSVVNQSGQDSPLPAALSIDDYSWSTEMALDVETAHMICQDCKILLVESDDDSVPNLAAAIAEAATFKPAAISNSWESEPDEPSLDSSVELTGTAVVFAAGDDGSGGPTSQWWPGDDPNVVTVGGTTLNLNADNTWNSETVWIDSGGGCAANYDAPTWQTSLPDWATQGCGTKRAYGDVSADADPNTGASVNINGSWEQVGGTSLAAPLVAGIFGLVGGVNTGVTASSVPYSASSSAFHDITSGNDCTSGQTTHCYAATGFDTPTGLGSPDGIAGFTSLPTQPTLTVTTVSQTEESLSWTASSATDGIAGYYIYRNGTRIATATTTSYDDPGLSANQTYSYYVVAFDTDDNQSLPSATVNGFTAIPEDINEDGHVNLLDLSILADKYGQCGASVGRADINGDGCVNLLDLSLLAQTYGSE